MLRCGTVLYSEGEVDGSRFVLIGLLSSLLIRVQVGWSEF